MALGVWLCKRERRRVRDENMNVGMAFCRNSMLGGYRNAESVL